MPSNDNTSDRDMARPGERPTARGNDPRVRRQTDPWRHFPRTSEPRDMTRCFVMMPIDKGFDEVYELVVKPTLAELGITAVRADEIYTSNPIIEDLWRQIQTAGWLIADLTDRNPNVLYELGLAHGIDREVILLAQKINDIPFDLRHWRCFEYHQSIGGAERLKHGLRRMIAEDAAYLRVPVELLTDRFGRAFRIHRTSTEVFLAGRNGSRASFIERWQMSPARRTETKVSDFVRKIQTSGRLTLADSETCAVEAREFMHGVYLLTVEFPTPLSFGEEVEYGLRYRVAEGFSPGEEFWNFDFDCDTEVFSYAFHFEEQCAPRDFRAERRTDGLQTTVRHSFEQDGGTLLYTVTGRDFAAGESLTFKWRWLAPDAGKASTSRRAES